MATANEIEIRVTVDDKTKAPFAKIEKQLKADAKKAGDAAGGEAGKAFSTSFAKATKGLKGPSIGGGGSSGSSGGGGGGGGLSGRRGGLFSVGTLIAPFKAFGSVLKSTFSLGTQLFSNMQAAMTGLMNGVFGLSGAFTTLFSGVGGGAKDVVGAVTSVVSSLAQVGVMLTAIGAIGGPILIALGAVAAGIGGLIIPALVGVFGLIGVLVAAQNEKIGEAFGELFADVGRDLQSMMKSSGFIDAILAISGQMRTAFAEMKPMLTEMFTALSPLVQTFAASITELAKNALPGMVEGFQNAEPIMEGFKTFLGSVGTGLGEMIQVIGEHAQGFKETLAGWGAVFEQVLPALGEFMGILADRMGPVLQQLAPLLADFVLQLGPPLMAAIEAVMPHMPALVQAFTDIGIAIIAAIPALTELAAAVLPLLPPVIAAFTDALNIALPVIRTFVGLTLGLFQLMTGDITAGMATIESVFAGTFGKMPDTATTAGEGVRVNLGDKLTQTNTDVLTNVGNIVNGIDGFKGDFFASGTALGDAFRRGIVDAINSAVDSVQAAVRNIMALFPNSPAKKGPLSGKGYTDHRGKQMMVDFAKGIAAGGGIVTATARGVTAAAQLALNGGKRGKRGPSLSLNPIYSAYSGAGAPSASMLSDHARQQRKAFQTAFGGLSGGGRGDMVQAEDGSWVPRSFYGGSSGGRGSTLTVSGDTDGALATMLMRLVREGKLQLA